ncbi:MAG: hypothetical protein JOZ69_04020 [Myxococcales bacterium]|nr:hypothetical protein [Myxococcales bacterium]
MPVTHELEAEASAQVSYADAKAVLDRSFAKWAAARCSPDDRTRPPSLSIEDLGATDAGYTPCEAGPCGFTGATAPHVVVFARGGAGRTRAARAMEGVTPARVMRGP